MQEKYLKNIYLNHLFVQGLFCLTECLLDELLQSLCHVGWTWRRILDSYHYLFLDGIDHKQ